MPLASSAGKSLPVDITFNTPFSERDVEVIILVNLSPVNHLPYTYYYNYVSYTHLQLRHF